MPDSPGKIRGALERLEPGRGAPFYVRLNRFFWSLGPDGIAHFLKLADCYTRRGHRVELQLRYHPRPDQEGRIDLWLDFVRRVVRRFGPDPGVRALQVTNEVNFYPIAPDASDSFYEGAREALVRGVVAAKKEARRLGYDQLRIGFNWAFRTDPAREQAFWAEIGALGGERFVRALDWVGLDAYPGTLSPPVQTADGYRDGMVSAISELHECYLPIAGIPATVPIKSRRTATRPSSPRGPMPSRPRRCGRWSAPCTSSAAPTTSPTIAGSTFATTGPALRPLRGYRLTPTAMLGSLIELYTARMYCRQASSPGDGAAPITLCLGLTRCTAAAACSTSST